MEKEALVSIINLVNNLKNSEEKFEEYYEKKDANKFNEMKKFILEIQKKIDEELK